MDPSVTTVPRRGRDGMPTWAKVLFGILIGCGALAVLAFIGVLVAGGFGFWWAMTPGEQVATERLMGPDSEVVLRVGDLASDAEATRAIGHALEEFQRASRARRHQQLPESMRWIEALDQGGRYDQTTLGMVLPSEATIVLEPGDGSPSFAAAINLRAYARMIKAMFGLSHTHHVSVAGGELYSGRQGRSRDAGGGGAFGFYKGTFLLADSMTTGRGAIERLADETAPGRAAGGLASRLDRLRAGGDLVVGVARAEALRRGLAPDANPVLADLLDGARWLEGSARILSIDEVAGSLMIEHAGASEAQAAPAQVAAVGAAWGAELAEEGLSLDVSSEVKGDRSESTWSIRGLDAALSRFLEESVEADADRRWRALQGPVARRP